MHKSKNMIHLQFIEISNRFCFFFVTDDLNCCFFLHSSPVSNNNSSGLASLCPAASFAHLIWRFILNCHLSWMFCSSILLLSRGLHDQFKFFLALCAILHLNSQHPSCSADPAGFSSLDSSSHLVSYWKSSRWLQPVEGHLFADLTTGTGTVRCLAVAAQPDSLLSHCLT